MSYVERERGSHAATTCSSQTLSKPRQLDESADLTVTVALLVLMQGKGKEQASPCQWQSCVPLNEASPLLAAAEGGELLLLPALYLIWHWSDCMIPQPKNVWCV